MSTSTRRTQRDCGTWTDVRRHAFCAFYKLTYNDSAVAEMGDRLTTIDMGRKLGALSHFLGRGAGFSFNTMSLGSRPTFLTSGILIRFAFGHNRYGPKIEGCAPLGKGDLGSPSNTLWPGPRPTCMPSFILIRPTVWPQYTNVTDRTDGTGQTDNGPIA